MTPPVWICPNCEGHGETGHWRLPYVTYPCSWCRQSGEVTEADLVTWCRETYGVGRWPEERDKWIAHCQRYYAANQPDQEAGAA